jgi:hypothetical protein
MRSPCCLCACVYPSNNLRTPELNNNSVQFVIIYVLSQQLLGQLQTQHSVDTGNYIMEQYNIGWNVNCRQALEKIRVNTET